MTTPAPIPAIPVGRCNCDYCLAPAYDLDALNMRCDVCGDGVVASVAVQDWQEGPAGWIVRDPDTGRLDYRINGHEQFIYRGNPPPPLTDADMEEVSADDLERLAAARERVARLYGSRDAKEFTRAGKRSAAPAK